MHPLTASVQLGPLFCAWELVCAATDFSASAHFGFFGGGLHPRTFCFRAAARAIDLDVRIAFGGGSDARQLLRC
jgi:hypothetical protein